MLNSNNYQCWILQKIQWHFSWIPILEYIDNSNQKYWNLRTLDICWNINRLLINTPNKNNPTETIFSNILLAFLRNTAPNVPSFPPPLPTPRWSRRRGKYLRWQFTWIFSSTDILQIIMYMYIYIRHLCIYMKHIYRFFHDAKCMCLHVDAT